jgi:hypothetical protein
VLLKCTARPIKVDSKQLSKFIKFIIEYADPWKPFQSVVVFPMTDPGGPTGEFIRILDKFDLLIQNKA